MGALAVQHDKRLMVPEDNLHAARPGATQHLNTSTQQGTAGGAVGWIRAVTQHIMGDLGRLAFQQENSCWPLHKQCTLLFQWNSTVPQLLNRDGGASVLNADWVHVQPHNCCCASACTAARATIPDKIQQLLQASALLLGEYSLQLLLGPEAHLFADSSATTAAPHSSSTHNSKRLLCCFP
jgi:hypothetical protein